MFSLFGVWSILKMFISPTTVIIAIAIGVAGYIRHDAKMDERARQQILCDGRVKVINDQIAAHNEAIRAAERERQRKIDELLANRAKELTARNLEQSEYQKRIDEYEEKLKDATTCLVTPDDVRSLQ